MPERPDYAELTRGQLAILDRINAGEAGLPVLQLLVSLAQDALGGLGAGFAEYAPGGGTGVADQTPGHGRVVAATGACEHAIGRRVDQRPGDRRTVLVELGAVDDEIVRRTADGEPCRMLATRCEAGGTTIGSLQVYFGDGEPPGPAYVTAIELLGAYVGRLYALQSGLPVYADAREAASRALRQENRDLWVAVTSHELRTPVTVIKGYADTLTNHWATLGDEGRQEAARVIGTRAGELARLVDRLLTATSEDGELGLAPAGPFDLVETLRTAVEELPADLRRRLVLDNLPAELPKAYGDRESIATILTELATNAEKYSPPGSAVEVCAGVDDHTLRFRVSDRGIGIRPEHVERAFERYWQAGSADSPHPGAGLGLYLVRRLVERQQGWVSLRPRDGGGTTAEVRLPRA